MWIGLVLVGAIELGLILQPLYYGNWGGLERRILLFGIGVALTSFLTAFLIGTHRYAERVERFAEERTAELTRANVRLLELGHLKDEFVALVSHELRTPLAVMREGISQILEGICGEVSANQQETLSVVLKNLDRLSDLISDMLDISKIEAGKLDLRLKTVNLADLALETCAVFQPRVRTKGLEIKVRITSREAWVRADSEKLSQVLLNLVGNAVKFTERGFVEVAVEEDGEEGVCCVVSDTGPGIAEEHLPKLFQKFQQFTRPLKSGEKGTGLGLAISKGIVELHGGKIWAESRLGQGSRFSFRLPRPSKASGHVA